MLLFYVLATLLTVLLTLLAGVYIFYRVKFQYWKKRNVKYLKPKFPTGNMGLANIKETLTETYHRLYNESKNEKFVGAWMMFKPMLLVNDLELIKLILIKDFNHFVDRGFYVDKDSDPLSGN